MPGGAPIRLGIALCVITSVTGYMAFLGLTTSWQYYLTVDECLATVPPMHRRMRVTGTIAIGSLTIAEDRRRATFALRGTDRSLSVDFVGMLPDNLVENIDVVAEGHLDSGGRLQSDKVMTRCASKYVADSGTTFAESMGIRRR